MGATDAVEQLRTAYDGRRWAEAVARLDEDTMSSLGATDLVGAATALWMMARYDDAMDALIRAHSAYDDAGDLSSAVRCAVWLAIGLADLHQPARAGGWAARAGEMAEELPSSDPARALAILPRALKQLIEGDHDAAEEGFARALRLARRARDPDATALACLGAGQANVVRGELATGMSMLDEAMVGVTAGEVSLIACGIIYCSVISECRLAWDVRRASEWTVELDRWCRSHETLVTYQGQCQANRAELLRLHGSWDEAWACAGEAIRLARAGDRAARFSAHYQRGEILRLRGRFDDADREYLSAAESGWPPQPGHALLRLGQGRGSEARTMIHRAREVVDGATAMTLLPALVEIEVANGDVSAARQACDELRVLNEAIDVPLLHATVALAEGRVLRAEGSAAAAATRLQQGLATWIALDAPYHAARTRAELASAFDDLGDGRAAARERELACRDFDRLGAEPARLWCEARGRASSVLTDREREVLQLVAAGKTNRQIATDLFLSEKTVARHLENMFAKIDVASRAAATAWAFEHGVV